MYQHDLCFWTRRITHIYVLSLVIFVNAQEQIYTVAVNGTQLTEDVIREFASNADPIEVVVNPDEVLEDVILRTCGQITPGYLEALTNFNLDSLGLPADVADPGRDVLYWNYGDQPQSIEIPFCFEPLRQDGNPIVFVSEFEDRVPTVALDPIQTVTFSYGAFGGGASYEVTRVSDILTNWADAPTIIADGPDVDFGNGYRGYLAQLNHNANYKLANLDPELLETIALAFGGTGQVPNSGIGILDEGSGTFVSLVGEAEFSEACGGNVPPPFDRDILEQFLFRNAAYRHSLTGQKLPLEVVILVPDTGLSGYQVPPFFERAIAVFGQNALQPYPSNYYNHGTQVAGVALGGVSFAYANVMNERPIRVEVENVSTALSDGEVDVNKEALFNIQSRLGDAKFDIINISFSFSKLATTFAIPESKNERTLWVIAAGNDGADGPELPPANFGGNPDKPLLTVTALQWNEGAQIWEMAKYSSRGSYVDLAAPGCLETFQYDPETNDTKLVKVAGTSFAAPLVSFTAALIKRERGINGIALKRHLLYSADENPALEGVAGGRILNVEKALASVFFDTVEFDDPTRPWKQGTVSFTQTDDIQFCEGKPILKREQLKKIIKIDGEQPPDYKIYYEELDPEHEFDASKPTIMMNFVCKTLNMSEFTITFPNGKKESKRFDDVKDIVFAIPKIY
jgi:subtilisin family serine protease